MSKKRILAALITFLICSAIGIVSYFVGAIGLLLLILLCCIGGVIYAVYMLILYYLDK